MREFGASPDTKYTQKLCLVILFQPPYPYNEGNMWISLKLESASVDYIFVFDEL